MVDNIVAPDLAGKKVNLANRDGWAKAFPDNDPTNTAVDEEGGSVTFGSDGKADVGAAFKTAIVKQYPNVQGI